MVEAYSYKMVHVCSTVLFKIAIRFDVGDVLSI